MLLSGAVEKLQKSVASSPLSALPSTVPRRWKETFFLRAFGFLKVPLILYVSPTVEEVSDERCVIRVPLNRRTRNHLGSMYFGALSIGADCAGGLMAMRLIHQSKQKISLIFKDFEAHFLKRPEGDVFFTCEEGLAIRDLVQKAIDSQERVHLPVRVVATVPSRGREEPVAQFKLTLSLKKKNDF